MDYDYIAYAGTDLDAAKAKVKGGQSIQVWEDGKIVGRVYYKHNRWVLERHLGEGRY